MNIKIISLVCSCLLVATSVFAQKKQRKDRTKITTVETDRVGINLYDGSFVIGDLINEDNKEVEVLLFEDDQVVIEHGLIKSMRKESEGISFTRYGRFNYDKGMFLNISPLGFGVSFDGNGSFFSHVYCGVHLNERIAVGGGTGFEFHNDWISGNWFDYGVIPIYGFAKYNINLDGPRLFVIGKLGYASNVEVNVWDNDDIRTNVYSQLGLGVVFPSRWTSRLSLEFGRTFMGVKGTINGRDWSGNPFTQQFTQLFTRNSFKIGIGINQ